MSEIGGKYLEILKLEILLGNTKTASKCSSLFWSPKDGPIQAFLEPRFESSSGGKTEKMS